jgi:hypothetical protein
MPSVCWADFYSCPHRTRLVQQLGNNVGYRHGILALILDRLFRPGIPQVGAPTGDWLAGLLDIGEQVGTTSSPPRYWQLRTAAVAR